MRFEDVCSILVQLEEQNNVHSIEINGIILWPLIRLCIWSELLKPSASKALNIQMRSRMLHKLRTLLHKPSNLPGFIPDEVSTVFLSKSVNLQKILSSGKLFDKIMDPLLFLENHQRRSQKVYLGPPPIKSNLFYLGETLVPGFEWHKPLPQHILGPVRELFSKAGLSELLAETVFKKAYLGYFKWYQIGLRVFKNKKNLKTVYLSCWYTPQNMGLIAAARYLGINTVDVQHGRQGLYHGMYSWWTSMPDGGYAMMPNWFWCWGKPSVQHILRHSSQRSVHRPFVGGFPWPDYFFSYISNRRVSSSNNARRVVLFTLQPPLGSQSEAIPDFVIDHLKSRIAESDLFIFRAHPNYLDGRHYCETRMRDVLKNRYIIDSERKNLYDQFAECTHHITGTSSCCYEAEMFGVPTLLFGPDAKAMYAEEIEAGRFSWTGGDVNELGDWLSRVQIVEPKQNNKYIESSLPLAKSKLDALRYPCTVNNLLDN